MRPLQVPPASPESHASSGGAYMEHLNAGNAAYVDEASDCLVCPAGTQSYVPMGWATCQ